MWIRMMPVTVRISVSEKIVSSGIRKLSPAMARNLGKIDTNKKHSYKYSQKVWAGFLATHFDWVVY